MVVVAVKAICGDDEIAFIRLSLVLRMPPDASATPSILARERALQSTEHKRANLIDF